MWSDEGMKALDLKGRKALVGVAIADSLARLAAKHFRQACENIAMTYLNDKARPHASRWPRGFFCRAKCPT
jgi:Arc/MetJ family transcription regulator